jgi:hypothetical protein
MQQQFGDNLPAGKAADVGGRYSLGAEWQRKTLPAVILILIRADHTTMNMGACAACKRTHAHSP